MKVTIEDKEYLVRWKHYTQNRMPCSTVCNIDIEEVSISCGYSTCAKSDHFSKQVGRKISLARAIKDRFSYEERKLVWQAYDEQIGLDKTKKKTHATH